MSNPVGRPMKYDRFILVLEDKSIYTPATIVRHGESKGLLPSPLAEAERKQVRLKIRHTLARFSANHGFPSGGDGWITIQGQAPLRGWSGKRWKEALEAKF